MSVRIDHIHLRRLRGTGAALDVKQLAPDINIIHGPNGIGKSTLALALQEALWPGSTELERPSLDAQLNVDGTPWKVSIEAGHAVFDGPDGGRPDLCSPDRRPRYLLALHDLVVSESGTDAEFAARVLRESLGGHDLDAAATSLGFTEKPSQPQGLKKELLSARRKLEEAQTHARGLETKRRELSQLEKERLDAERARAEAGIVARVLAVLEAQQELQAAQHQLAALPEAAGRLHGSEKESLQTLRNSELGLLDKIKQADEEVKRLDAELVEHALVGDVPEATTRGQWKALVRQAENSEKDLAAYRSARLESEAALRELDKELSESAGGSVVMSLSRGMVRRIEPLFREWLSLQSEGQLLDKRRHEYERSRSELAEPAPVSESASIESLREALRQLEAWLRAPLPDTTRKRNVWVIALAVLAVATGVISGIFASPLFFIVPFLAAVLVYLHRRGGDPLEGESRGRPGRHDVERMWDENGVAGPSSWTENDIVETHRALTAALLQKERRETDDRTRAVRMRELEEDERSWQKKRKEALAELEALGREIGWPLTEEDAGPDGGLTARALWLVGLAEQLVKRGERQVQLMEAAAAEEAAVKELGRLLGELEPLVRAIGLDSPVDGAGAAREALDLLDKRIQALEKAQQERRSCLRRLNDEWRPGLEEIQKGIRELFERLDLEPGDEVRLSRLLELRTTWIEADEARRIAEHQVQQAERVLREEVPPGSMVGGVESLLMLPKEDLESRKRGLEDRAATRDELTTDIAKVEKELEIALEKKDVAQAAAARDAAQEKLESALAANQRMVIGNEVVRFVREQTVQETLPHVFVRARSLLASFTAGALELELDLESKEPRFLAKTDGSLRARPVTELSVGERVQLLMAVRMAFLEQEETSPLPLILDETLGTTDDARAQAVLTALMGLAGEGRQLFYFTAQTDEVAKWLEVLKELPGRVEDRVTDLAAVRRGTASDAAPLPTASLSFSKPDVPAPGGHDHESYGRLLDVPGIRPHDEEVDAVHIWHVLDTADEVYRLLQRRVETVGQYRVLASGGHEDTGTEEVRDRVAARIGVLEDAMTLWRQGRGKPLTRDVIEAAPGVSSRKLDEVWALAEGKDFQASRLLAGLLEGEVSRFRQDKREELAAYLEESGFISSDEPLSASDARLLLQARHPKASLPYVERVVAVLWQDES